MAKVDLTGFSIQKNLFAGFISKTDVSYKDPVKYDFWDLEHIPQKPGVYLVYDVAGDCIYAGGTPFRFDLRYRISEHLREANFREYGYQLLFFETKEDTTDILLLEKIFTKALGNPPFNKERSVKKTTHSLTGFDYIKKNKSRHYKNWQNNWGKYEEQKARIEKLPVTIIKLKEKIEETYNFLDDLPLVNDEINSHFLLGNVKKMQKFGMLKDANLTVDDVVKELLNQINYDELKDGEITRLVLNTTQYDRYMRKKRRKKMNSDK